MFAMGYELNISQLDGESNGDVPILETGKISCITANIQTLIFSCPNSVTC